MIGVIIEDSSLRPQHLGEKVGLNAAERTIFLKNEDGKIAEVLPLVYVLWRKANGNNSLEDIIEYTMERTQKRRGFVEKIINDVFENLKSQKLLDY